MYSNDNSKTFIAKNKLLGKIVLNSIPNAHIMVSLDGNSCFVLLSLNYNSDYFSDRNKVLDYFTNYICTHTKVSASNIESYTNNSYAIFSIFDTSIIETINLKDILNYYNLKEFLW